MSFLSSLTSLVEFSNEEKLPLLKTIEKLKQSKTVQQANFIHSAIYSFLFRCLHVQQPDKVFKILNVQQSLFCGCRVNTDRTN